MTTLIIGLVVWFWAFIGILAFYHIADGRKGPEPFIEFLDSIKPSADAALGIAVLVCAGHVIWLAHLELFGGGA